VTAAPTDGTLKAKRICSGHKIEIDLEEKRKAARQRLVKTSLVKKKEPLGILTIRLRERERREEEGEEAEVKSNGKRTKLK
jgi:hypothetical protein